MNVIITGTQTFTFYYIQITTKHSWGLIIPNKSFTFYYIQITTHYPHYLCRYFLHHLHSTIFRLLLEEKEKNILERLFTFYYIQITTQPYKLILEKVYIPLHSTIFRLLQKLKEEGKSVASLYILLYLDYYYKQQKKQQKCMALHSTIFRLLLITIYVYTFSRRCLYILLYLDYYHFLVHQLKLHILSLHSTIFRLLQNPKCKT